MKILLSSNMMIVKEYIMENSKVGFIPTASELDDDRWYMEESRNELKNMNFDVIDIEISKESAGACIACPSINYVEKLDNKLEAPLLKNYNAMNLIDGYILPHYQSKEKYTNLSNGIIEEYQNLNFIALTNEQAIIVNDRNDYQVINTD